VVVTDAETRRAVYLSHTGVRLLTSGRRKGARIGEVLLKTGKISQKQLDLVLEKQTKSNLRFGELLYLMCMITEEDIKRAVKTQIEEEIYDLFTWEGSSAEFVEGAPPPELRDPEAGVTNLSFPVAEMLEEAARRVQEWEAFRSKLPAKGKTLLKQPPPQGRSEAPFNDRMTALLELLDGRRTMEQILEASPMFRFETLRALAYFVSTQRAIEATPSDTALRASAAPAVRAPGDAPAREPSQRFSLDQVPDVDWGGVKTEAPVDPGATPPTALKKQDTSVALARKAKDATRFYGSPFGRRRGGRLGWALAAGLAACVAGAVGYEGNARRKWKAADEAARGELSLGNAAKAREMYAAFAEAYPVSSVASVARRAAEDAEKVSLLTAARAAAAAFGTAWGERLRERVKGMAPEAAAELLKAEGADARKLGHEELAAWCESEAVLAEGRSRRAAGERKNLAESVAAGDVAAARAAAGALEALDPSAPRTLPMRVETVPPGATVVMNGIVSGTSPCVVLAERGRPGAVQARLRWHEDGETKFTDPAPEKLVLVLARSASWSVRADSAIRRPLATLPGAVYAVCDDGTLVAVGLARGSMLWRSRPGSNPFSTPPAAGKGAVFASGTDGIVRAIDVTDGTSLWNVPAGGAPRGPLAVTEDRALVFAAGQDGGVTTLDAATGKILGRVPLEGDVACGPLAMNASWVVVLSDGRVRSGSADAAGWNATLPAAPAACAVTARGPLCACSDGTLVLLDAGDGGRLWLSAAGNSPTSLAVSGDLAVVVFGRRAAAGFDLRTGDRHWTVADAGAEHAAGPALAPGLALLPGADGALRALDAADGSLRWISRPGGRFRAPPSVTRDAVLLGTDDGSLFAIPLEIPR
jgi:outer membrane protein assembly factor BamB